MCAWGREAPRKNNKAATHASIFSQLFEKLRETVPKFRHKIVTVAGDCSIAGLGLSLTDRQTLASNISIIFHAAATVKFDENLKLAVDINVHGTKDVIELAKEMKNLKVKKVKTKTFSKLP